MNCTKSLRSLFIALVSFSVKADTPIFPQKAFCCVPVADLVGISMEQAQKHNLAVQHYYEQPFAEKTADQACTRLSQLLLHECCQVVGQRANELRIEISHWFYYAGNPPQKKTSYWVDKEALFTFNDLSPSDRNKIPPPISFSKTSNAHESCITLRLPFIDKTSKIAYSAGTRFVKCLDQPNRKKFAVHVFCPLKKYFKILFIPRKLCVETVRRTGKEKRKLFVEILKQWAHTKGYIPYVFGGASIGMPLKKNHYTRKHIKNGKKTVTFYERSEASYQPVKMGIDCSHLIARAAQIAGINYFVKNTTSIKKELKPLKPGESIENGDIIVWQGHTAVVIDANKGLLIEARGYDHDYGIVQEIPFFEQFQGIVTAHDLTTAFLKKSPLSRLDRNGKKIQTIYDLSIMKLPV